jgi:hypothetical protein
MALKNFFIAAVGVTALAWNGLSAAQQYRADEFLNLDLSRAVLSPKLLGPAASFAPGPLDVTIDRGNDAAQASAESVAEPKSEPKSEPKTEPKSEPKTVLKSAPESEPKTVSTATVHVESRATPRTALRTAASGMRVARAHAERSTHAPRTALALHRRNPVDAEARDTRIQIWPCKSGGICSWKR